MAGLLQANIRGCAISQNIKRDPNAMLAHVRINLTFEPVIRYLGADNAQIIIKTIVSAAALNADPALGIWGGKACVRASDGSALSERNPVVLRNRRGPRLIVGGCNRISIDSVLSRILRNGYRLRLLLHLLLWD